MKNLFVLVISLCLATTAFSQSKPSKATPKVKATAIQKAPPKITTPAAEVDPATLTKMVFTESLYEFGTVKQNDVVEHTFKFTNEGDVPLVITGAKSTCGCTVPTFPKEAILPGEEGEIKVRFNTRGKSGKQRKPVNITANTNPPVTTAYISGIVEKPVVEATTKPAPKATPAVKPN